VRGDQATDPTHKIFTPPVFPCPSIVKSHVSLMFLPNPSNVPCDVKVSRALAEIGVHPSFPQPPGSPWTACGLSLVMSTGMWSTPHYHLILIYTVAMGVVLDGDFPLLASSLPGGYTRKPTQIVRFWKHGK